jgi:hypothetical protein
MIHSRIVRGRPAGAVAIVVAFALAGCSSSTGAPSAVASALANAPAVVLPSDTPAASEAAPSSADSSETPLPSAVVTDIDPCQLITSDDASAFVGVKFGPGKATTTENNLKICSYSGPGPNVFMVQVAVAPDVATAQAAEAQAKADLASKGATLDVVPLPSFADNTDAAILQGAASGGGLSIAGRGLMLLRGTTFVGFSDIAAGGGQPPSEQAFQDQGNAVLAKLP